MGATIHIIQNNQQPLTPRRSTEHFQNLRLRRQCFRRRTPARKLPENRLLQEKKVRRVPKGGPADPVRTLRTSGSPGATAMSVVFPMPSGP